MSHRKDNRYTLELYVVNKPGVLVRIALVFARRGHNIDQLSVSEDLRNLAFSNMAIQASGDARMMDQILKQLNKLVDVIYVYRSDIYGKEPAEQSVGLAQDQNPAYGKGSTPHRPAPDS